MLLDWNFHHPSYAVQQFKASAAGHTIGHHWCKSCALQLSYIPGWCWDVPLMDTMEHDLHHHKGFWEAPLGLCGEASFACFWFFFAHIAWQQTQVRLELQQSSSPSSLSSVTIHSYQGCRHECFAFTFMGILSCIYGGHQTYAMCESALGIVQGLKSAPEN